MRNLIFSATYTLGRAHKLNPRGRVGVPVDCFHRERGQADRKEPGLYNKVWQSFAVLLPVMSVGVMGDMRTYAYTCAIRAVSSEDGMTADWVPLPHEVLKTISTRIVNQVNGLNRLFGQDLWFC
jgi:hypothetical protein